MALFPHCCLTPWWFTDRNLITSQPLLCWDEQAKHSVTALVTQSLTFQDWLYNVFLHDDLTCWSSVPWPAYRMHHLRVHLPFLMTASFQQLLEVNSLAHCVHLPKMSSQPAAPVFELLHFIPPELLSNHFLSFRSCFQSFLILHRGGIVSQPGVSCTKFQEHNPNKGFWTLARISCREDACLLWKNYLGKFWVVKKFALDMKIVIVMLLYNLSSNFLCLSHWIKIFSLVST